MDKKNEDLLSKDDIPSVALDIFQLQDIKAYSKDISEIFREMKTSPNGLSSTEAEIRAQSGKNAIEEKEKESLLKKFMEKFTEPLIALLLASAVISILIGQYDDAFSIIIAVLIVSTVGFVQEYRSEQSLEALTQFVSHKCHVLRDGEEKEVLAEDIVQGDIVILNRGYRVPADVRLFEVIELRVDESLLTGESNPARKYAEPIDEHVLGTVAVADLRNMGFMGTMVVSGKAKGVVVATGDTTELGKISQMIQNAESQKTPLQVKMDQLGKHLSMLSFGIIGVIFLLGAIQGNEWLEMFNVAVSLAVAAIPEGLPIVVTVTLALGVTRMAKRHAIIRKLPAVEALGGVSVICVDKTGTITQNKMTVTRLYTNCYITTLPNNIDNNKLEYFYDSSVRISDPQRDSHLKQLLTVGLLCNNAQMGYDGTVIGFPTEGALLSAAFAAGLDDLRRHLNRLDEIPFDSEKKFMSVKYETVEGVRYFVKGAVEVVLDKCSNFYDHNQSKFEVLDASSRFASAGLRVIAMAYGDSLNNLTFVGIAGISDPPRPGVKEAIRKTKESGIHVVMITGDSKETAVAVATEVGFHNPDNLAISCHELENMSETELTGKLDRISVFYRMAPSHKMKIVQAFRLKGQVVAMTGDGVNDSPALKIADIGIAMGKGSDVCKESAEMILVDNNFATIVAAIEEGKSIYNNIQNFLRFQLSTSMAALSIIAYCTLFGYPLPLNPMQILWINIIMDGPPAQSLGVEPLTQDVMKSPPRDPRIPVISKNMIRKIAVGAIMMVVGTLFVFFNALDDEALDATTQAHRAGTMAFTTFVMFQMFNALNCRNNQESVFKLGMFTNQYFLIACGGSILMQLFVVYLPFLQYTFETVALSFSDVVTCTLVASTVFVVDELWKRSNPNPNANF